MVKYFFLSLFLVFSGFMEVQAKLHIDEHLIVPIGGINQVITIKSTGRDKPILLFLHGGPGSSLIPVSASFTDKLQTEFTVIQWDQRQTGETAALNNSPVPLTPELMKSDASEMVQYILNRLNQPKLFLVSHSWGSVLGFDLAEHHPELLYAYICISGIIDQEKNAALTVDMLHKWAKSTKNKEASNELKKVNIPFKVADDLFYSQKWLFIHNGVEFAQKEDFKPTYYRWLDTWFPMWLASVQGSKFKQLTEVKCPIYFLEGNGDKQASHQIVEDYYHFIKAPKKDFFWFTKSGHTIFNTEPEKIQSVIIKDILPETHPSYLLTK